MQRARPADAGYDIALDCVREQGLDLPGILDKHQLMTSQRFEKGLSG